MNKFTGIVAVLVVFVVSAFSGTVRAQGAEVRLPPSVAACMKTCLASAPASGGTGCDPETMCKRIGALERDLADLRARLFPKRVAAAPHADRVKLLQEQLKALTGRMDKNDAGIARTAQQLADETAKLNLLTVEIEPIKARITEVERQLGDINKMLGEHEVALAAHRELISGHERRIEKLELEKPSIKVGFHGGVIGVYAPASGTGYPAFPITASLVLPVSNRVSLVTEAGIALSVDKHPIGTLVRGAVQYGLDRNWSMSFGATSLWAGFDSRLKAAQASVLADVGPVYKNGVFTARAAVLAGPAFEPAPKGPSFAIGGSLMIGVLLP